MAEDGFGRLAGPGGGAGSWGPLWGWPGPVGVPGVSRDRPRVWVAVGPRAGFPGGSKITADDDCSHEIKRCLLLGRKVMMNLDSILKTRDIALPTKVHLVKAMVFPAVMYGCESWTMKKKIDAFELWCWRSTSQLLLGL